VYENQEREVVENGNGIVFVRSVGVWFRRLSKQTNGWAEVSRRMQKLGRGKPF